MAVGQGGCQPGAGGALVDVISCGMHAEPLCVFVRTMSCSVHSLCVQHLVDGLHVSAVHCTAGEPSGILSCYRGGHDVLGSVAA